MTMRVFDPRRSPSRSRRSGFARAVVVVVSLGATLPIRAHTPITTSYSFDADVRPVLEKHCVRCHSPGGPTPMSLVSYKDARPWAESIKEQLLARSMPPLFVEHGSIAVLNGSPLTARELDILVDWATGGAPETSSRRRAKGGDVERASAGSSREASRMEPSAPPEGEWVFHEWSDFVSPEDQDASERAVGHRLLVSERRHITGWRLDGDPWLRGAVLWVEENVTGGYLFLGSWIAGDESFLLPEGASFELPPGSTIRVVARYRRTWLLRSRKLDPSTRLGLRYASDATPRRVVSVALGPGQEHPAWLATGSTAIAFYPSQPEPGVLTLERDAGSRTLLDIHRVSGDWPILYRFAAPETGRLEWRPRSPVTDPRVRGYALYVMSR